MKALCQWCWGEREGWQGQKNAGLQCGGGKGDKLLWRGQDKMKPRKDEILALGAFQAPGDRKGHGALLCREGMLPLQPPGAPDLTQKSSEQLAAEETSPQDFSIFYAKSFILPLGHSHLLESSPRASLAWVKKSLL